MTERPETTIARRALAAGITQFINENSAALDRLAAQAAKFIHENHSFFDGLKKVARSVEILEPAFRDAGVPDNKIKLLIGKALLEIAAGQTDAKSLRGGKRSGERRREIASNGWQALAGPRGDEIKRENPSFKPYRIARLMLKKDHSGLPGERTLAEFLAKRYAADSDWG
ncbi:MAG TPA: hypothetical protein VN890_05750 [Methylocella sp.]|nr:hypothetical protein [Methylocella sp.]